ncbi:hypothetical protein PHYPSEUDO_013235 [Phytophthora pseudosyringae]|uniref:Uncharacterized protein n=1 Tax=Phytophthora pseudosyringae TaxID=221518 RepID=A0A8T1W729_9STRA|nr:hypothetical protein PHYPSEUDO_013235 [Phytophthora pseudosyringae]
MSSNRLTMNVLSFVGPAPAAALSATSYVHARGIDGGTATVRVVGPDADEEGEDLLVLVSTLEPRVVAASEATMWPGGYVGHPVAFFQASGPRTGQWAYGVITRYEDLADGPSLSVLTDSAVVAVRLLEPLRVINVDPLTYSLKVGSTMVDMVHNPKKHLQQQNTVIALCRKRRSDIPVSVRSFLSIPFVLHLVVSHQRPHDLVKVRRQHVLDCLMGSRKNNNVDLYKDPQLPRDQDAEIAMAVERTTVMQPPDDDLLSISGESELDDIDAIWPRTGHSGSALVPWNMAVESSVLGRPAVMAEIAPVMMIQKPLDPQFRGASSDNYQRRVSRTILHEQFQSKSSHLVFDRMRQSVHTPFLAVQPICRGLLDYGFGVHSLMLMHCHPADLWDRVKAQYSNISFTDVSERNTLRSVAPSASRNDVNCPLHAPKVSALHL